MKEAISLTAAEWQHVKALAQQRTSQHNGHYFVQPTPRGMRCAWCRCSRQVERRCGGWFRTFLAQMDEILLHLDHYRAIWRVEARSGHPVASGAEGRLHA